MRPSTPRILAACAQAVRDLGGEPVFSGFVPTPALADWAFAQGIPSLMVTGSHIPDDRNGIKFYRPHGEILKNDGTGLLAPYVPVPLPADDCRYPKMRHLSSEQLGELSQSRSNLGRLGPTFPSQ